MPNLTVFHDPEINVAVIPGDPPVDQSALVASLTAQVATLTSERDAALAKVAIARADAQARKDADAAKTEGQDLLDALG